MTDEHKKGYKAVKKEPVSLSDYEDILNRIDKFKESDGKDIFFELLKDIKTVEKKEKKRIPLGYIEKYKNFMEWYLK